MLTIKLVVAYRYRSSLASTVKKLKNALLEDILKEKDLKSLGELTWIKDSDGDQIIVGGEQGYGFVNLQSSIVTEVKPNDDSLCGQIIVDEKMVTFWNQKVSVHASGVELWKSEEYLCDK